MKQMLNQVADWIKTFPHWGTQPLTIDLTPPAPGTCGLFPAGEEELSRREDVLGNTTCRYRQEYLLRRVALRGEDAAAWMLSFGRWARTVEPPAIGQETVAKATRGRLLTSVNTGIATYEIKISMEYTEELKNGKN